MQSRPLGTQTRLARHRAKMRSAGMRMLQLWVPDTRLPAFAKECRRQSRLAAKADHKDSTLAEFMDAALTDIEGWKA